MMIVGQRHIVGFHIIDAGKSIELYDTIRLKYFHFLFWTKSNTSFKWSITIPVVFSVIPTVFDIYWQCPSHLPVCDYRHFYWRTFPIFLFGHKSRGLWRHCTWTLGPNLPCPIEIFRDLQFLISLRKYNMFSNLLY